MSPPTITTPPPPPTTSAANAPAPGAAPAFPDVATLDQQARAGNFSGATTTLTAISARAGRGEVSTAEARALLPTLERTAQAAEAAESWGALAIILSILTCGIYAIGRGIHDAVTTTDAERAQELATRLRATLQQQSGVDPSRPRAPTGPARPGTTPAPPPPTRTAVQPNTGTVPAEVADIGRRAERFDASRHSPRVITEAQATAIKNDISAALTALRNGDDQTARAAFARLGLPLPSPLPDGYQLSDQQRRTAIVLGAVTVRYDHPNDLENTGFSTSGWRIGAHGNQQLNVIQGLAQNAITMDEMAKLGVTPAPLQNPPTEAQAMDYARRLQQKYPNDPGARMRAIGQFIEGTMVHYSSAGLNKDLSYDGATTRHFVMDRSTTPPTRRDFPNQASARDWARDHGLSPNAARSIRGSVPNEWADVDGHTRRSGQTEVGDFGGRHVADCETKQYVAFRMAEAAGLTAIGSIGVQGAGTGHAIGVVQAPNGQVFITSNEEITQVTGTGPNGAVTHADIMQASEDATRRVYHIDPGDSLGNLRLYPAREPSPRPAGVGPGVEASWRSYEYAARGVRYADDRFSPAPPPPPPTTNP